MEKRNSEHIALFVDHLTDWAEGQVAESDWSRWLPDLNDPLVAPRITQDEPPLPLSLVVEYARFQAWLEGRPVTPADVEAFRGRLAERWLNSVIDPSLVREVLAEMLIWGQIVRMPEVWQEETRAELLRRPESGALPTTESEAAPPSPPPPAPAPAEPQPVDVEQAIKDMSTQGQVFRGMLQAGAGLGPKPPGFF